MEFQNVIIPLDILSWHNKIITGIIFILQELSVASLYCMNITRVIWTITTSTEKKRDKQVSSKLVLVVQTDAHALNGEWEIQNLQYVPPAGSCQAKTIRLATPVMGNEAVSESD